MSKKTVITITLWALFAVCAIAAVFLNRQVLNGEVEYEEVQVTVISSKTVEYVNRKTGSRTSTCEVDVRYQGKTYRLENAHSAYMYREGAQVKAYLANGRLFANVEGVKTSTPLAAVYFATLFGSFGLLFAALLSMSKSKKRQAA